MAPGKDINKNTARYVKELVLSKHCKKGDVPPDFTSLHSCERNFGFNYQVHTLRCVDSWGSGGMRLKKRTNFVFIWKTSLYLFIIRT